MTPKIFIVEDDDILVKTTEWRVLKMGYIVAGKAASGEEAIQRITNTRPDVVLMDICLKGPLDGIETATLIRKNLGIPVIYLTAQLDNESISRAKETGPGGYLVKPFSDKDLFAAIQLAVS